MEDSKKIISEGNFVVYIWFWGGFITLFVTNWFSHLLKTVLSSDGGSILYTVIIYIFDIIVLYLVVKYMIGWIEGRYELTNKKKLVKATFNIFLAWSLVEIVIAYFALSVTDRTNTTLLVLTILGIASQLIAVYVSLNRYLKIKYF